jgi:flagellar biosynthesis regulator FlaF
MTIKEMVKNEKKSKKKKELDLLSKSLGIMFNSNTSQQESIETYPFLLMFKTRLWRWCESFLEPLDHLWR